MKIYVVIRPWDYMLADVSVCRTMKEARDIRDEWREEDPKNADYIRIEVREI